MPVRGTRTSRHTDYTHFPDPDKTNLGTYIRYRSCPCVFVCKWPSQDNEYTVKDPVQSQDRKP